MMNWTGIRRIKVIGKEPVTVDEVLEQLRLDNTEQNLMIENQILTARLAIEKELNRALVYSTYQLSFDRFDDKEFELLLSDEADEIKIKYFDVNNVEQTLAPSAYFVDSARSPVKVFLAYLPNTYEDRPSAVTVKYNTGYIDTIPQPIKQAIIMLACDLYLNPEVKTEVKLYQNKTYNLLLNDYRIFPI